MAQMSLWSLMAAPLVLSCDLSHLDPNAFHRSTTAILTNDEVLDVDQDALGKTGYRVADTAGMQIWVRPLSDGTWAVGLLNLTPAPQTMRVRWGTIGLKGPQPVRDLWLHQDLGTFVGAFSGEVPSRGVILLKVGKPKG
jgi:alpha-galactosidase